MTGLCVSPFVVILVLWGAVVWHKALKRRAPEEDPAPVPDSQAYVAAASLAAVVAGLEGVAEYISVPFLLPSACARAFGAAAVSVLFTWIAVTFFAGPSRMGRVKTALGSGLVAALAIIALAGWFNSTGQRTARIIAEGRLAPLPRSARDVRALSWAAGFGGASFLKFTASREDIDAFIASSPSLKDVTPVIGPPAGSEPPEGNAYLTLEEFRDSINHRYPEAPWFTPSLKPGGRGYRVPSVGDHNGGHLVVDPETNTVYVAVFWG